MEQLNNFAILQSCITVLSASSMYYAFKAESYNKIENLFKKV